MPNQLVDANGVLQAQVFYSFVTLGTGETDLTGRALLIHDGQGDHCSQPADSRTAR